MGKGVHVYMYVYVYMCTSILIETTTRIANTEVVIDRFHYPNHILMDGVSKRATLITLVSLTLSK